MLDTNILVSAGLKPDSDVARILERVLLRQVPVFICPALEAEYREVLSRPKFRKAGFPPAWFPRFTSVAFLQPDPKPWPLEGPDPDDLPFLALAHATGAVLVTGNKADFPSTIRRGVKVMSPSEYLKAWPA